MRRSIRSLLLGVVATVLSAWSCVIWSSPESGARRNLGPQPWYLAEPHLDARCDERQIRSGIGLRLHHCFGTSNRSESISIRDQGQKVLEAGWPMPALVTIDSTSLDIRAYLAAGTMAGFRPADDAWRWSLPIPGWAPESRYDRDGAGLPFMPIVGGFAGDTLFFAACAWLAAFAIRTGIERRRTSRGRCPGCAHTLAGCATCPECGRTAPRRLQVRSAP